MKRSNILLSAELSKSESILLPAHSVGWRNVFGPAHCQFERRRLESYNLESGSLMMEDVVGKKR